MVRTYFSRLGAVLLFALLALGNTQSQAQETAKPTSELSVSYIVQAKDIATAIAAVKKVGGQVASEFNIIRSINARLTQAQLLHLQKIPGIKVYEDQQASTSAVTMPAREEQ